MGFLERRKKKKRYKDQVCPECGNPMNEITRDYDYKGGIKEFNIGGTIVGREKKMLKPHFYGDLKGYKCSRDHKWADKFNISKVVVECPNDKCDGKLKTNNNMLECEYNGEGCYVSGIKVVKTKGRHLKHFIRNMKEDMEDNFYSWDFTYFTQHGKNYSWYDKIKTTEEVESPEEDIKKTAERQIEEIENQVL